MVLLTLSSIAGAGLAHGFGTLVAALATLDMPGVDLIDSLPAVAASAIAALRRRRGRPRKFDAPSRAVTLTLPESVLERLSGLNPDLSLAVAQLAQRRGPVNGRPPADLKVFGHRAVITIKPTPALERRAGVDLVPVAEGRALISFAQPRTIADLEVVLHDALEDASLGDEERQIFASIVAILKDARRSKSVTLTRRNIIVLEMMTPKAKRAGEPE